MCGRASSSCRWRWRWSCSSARGCSSGRSTPRAIDPGFSARDGLVGSIDLGTGYDEGRGKALYRRITDELRTLPGVEAAALGDAPFVIVVNETMARRYWGEGRGLGGRVKIGDRWAEVVGVSKDAKYSSMSEAPRSFMYLPVEQAWRPTMRLIVRTTGTPDALVGSVRQALRRVDPSLPLFDVQTFEQHIAFAFFLFEMAATLLGVFGATATLLAALGLYGVVAHSVGMRTREIGVRISLGATAGDVRQMVVRQGLALAVLGIALGLGVALAVTRLFSSRLLGVSPYDPASYGLTALLLVATTAAACYLPARRAARLDPVQALRTE